MTQPSDTPLFEIGSSEQLTVFSETDISNQEADIYIWEIEEDSNHEEHIAHFSPGKGGDVLQLNNLLVDQKYTSQLGQYLHFRFDGHNTTIEIRPEGQASNDAHFIVLDNVDLSAFGHTDEEIIEKLMGMGNLDIVGMC